MDNGSYNPSDKESSERRNSNSEWLPTKCRITKPPPPKPATNPLQFVKVAPSALFQKAHEQIKKVEEIKTQKHAVKEEAEEWQQNLDNWKSSRRKRQEHIIERVVEVKKLEQVGHDKSRRKSKTFNEMLEDRNKRGHRLNIPIYDDDSNDLSDFGIGSSGSRTNSIKDVDTDDSSSCLDEKEHAISVSDLSSGKDASSTSNQSQSEDELLSVSNYSVDKITKSKPSLFTETELTTVHSNSSSTEKHVKPVYELNVKDKDEDLTYQRAIEDYRSKILPKVNDTETVLTVKFDTNITEFIPHVEMFANKALCDPSKPVEITRLDLNSSKRPPEDFTNPLSIKERLRNLEKCAGLQVKSVEPHCHGNSVKSIIESFTRQCDNDNKNNNIDSAGTSSSDFPNHVKLGNITENVSLFLVEDSSNICNSTSKVIPGSASPETMTYINNLNLFNQNLDTCLLKSHSAQSSLSEYSEHIAAPPSVSFSELTGVSSDRADSGIHTADVSCSVSQADESVEFSDMLASTIPNCIEKLQKERERELTQQVESKLHSKLIDRKENLSANAETTHNFGDFTTNYEVLKQSTRAFLDNIRQDISNEYGINENTNLIFVCTDKINGSFSPQQESQLDKINMITDSCTYQQVPPFLTGLSNHSAVNEFKEHPHEYMNTTSYDFLDPIVTSAFPLAPPKTKEPPKEKPPPPPVEDKNPQQTNAKRMNSTKRIKRELYIKRSSFLGLDEPMIDVNNPAIPTYTLSDISTCLQKESKLEKSLYQIHHGNHEACSSEVESQDSGLESERGRLSSDTWCSSLGECNILTHGKQDSMQTNNSVTSDEDEIAKKEKEIIALVEKEEKSKSSRYEATSLAYSNMVHNNSKGDKKTPWIPKVNLDYHTMGTDEDSEVLKVEHELLQLEKEELKRQKENILLNENKERILHKNRYSLENVGGSPDSFSDYYGDGNCRKSMSELPNAALHFNQVMKRCTPQYHKSVPNLQQACLKAVNIDIQLPLEHRKSMPDLQKAPISAPPYIAHNRNLIIPSKPMTSLIKEQRSRDKILTRNQLFEADTVHYQNIRPMVPITRPGINILSAVPKHRYIPNENWIQPKNNGEGKSRNYNKHWFYQEAELRRSAEQKTNDLKWNYQEKNQTEKISQPVVHKFSQGYPNQPLNEHSQQNKRSEANISQQTTQHQTYYNRPHMVGHASSNSYSQLPSTENSNGMVLSISGKKKCSFCGNELGRGAAMIIETLCLFYHMDCFKCCVCHVQLGTAMVGTDVRVRNNKIHCNNCYTTEDGVKFSCV